MQERIKVREGIRHIHVGPIPIVIPLKLFLERTGFSVDTFSRVAWKFHGGAKVQNMSGVRELR